MGRDDLFQGLIALQLVGPLLEALGDIRLALEHFLLDVLRQRGEVRSAGCEIVGDDRAGYGPRYEYRPEGVGRAIKDAIEKLSAR